MRGRRSTVNLTPRMTQSSGACRAQDRNKIPVVNTGTGGRQERRLGETGKTPCCDFPASKTIRCLLQRSAWHFTVLLAETSLAGSVGTKAEQTKV